MGVIGTGLTLEISAGQIKDLGDEKSIVLGGVDTDGNKMNVSIVPMNVPNTEGTEPLGADAEEGDDKPEGDDKLEAMKAYPEFAGVEEIEKLAAESIGEKTIVSFNKFLKMNS